jgi:hypothetical protein
VHLELSETLQCLIALIALVDDFGRWLGTALLQLGLWLVPTPSLTFRLQLELVLLARVLVRVCICRGIALTVKYSNPKVLSQAQVRVLALLLEVIRERETVVAKVDNFDKMCIEFFIPLNRNSRT